MFFAVAYLRPGSDEHIAGVTGYGPFWGFGWLMTQLVCRRFHFFGCAVLFALSQC
jgi:hypothetical protein